MVVTYVNSNNGLYKTITVFHVWHLKRTGIIRNYESRISLNITEDNGNCSVEAQWTPPLPSD